MKPTTLWTREKDKGTMSVKDGAAYVKHSGSADYAVVLHDNIKVVPGDSFRISCKISNEGSGTVAFAVGMFDADNKIITWTQGHLQVKGNVKEKTLEQEFAIPFGGASILPRIMGSGEVNAKFSDYKIEKSGTVALLQPKKELPASGKDVELLPPTETSFGKALQFKGRKEFVNERGRIPWSKVDEGLRYEDKSTWKIAASDGLYFNVMPLEPFKCSAGDSAVGKVLISLRIYVERGRPFLAVYPWKGGMLGSEPIARGTYQPAQGEETGIWCCIHSYVSIPEGIDGLMPVICAEDGGVFNLAEWKVAVPSADELSPKSKKVNGWFKERKDEIFDRGLTAIKTGSNVYLSWRLLKTDKDSTAFDVYRVDANGKAVKLNQTPVKQTTDVIDSNVPAGSFNWYVQVADSQENAVQEKSNPAAALDKPYRSIKLRNAKSVASIAFADLDGDGVHDFVVKTPNDNIDPWYLYWYKSPETYKLQGYKSDGTFLWEYDMGWGIERGIWYAPFIVADLDGDNCAEIIVKSNPGDFRNSFGRVYDGPEYLSILDGKTGKERVHTDWISRDGWAYNHGSREQLGLAYLDGKTPCVILERGTYDRMVAVAFQFKNSPDVLEELWRWDNRWERDKGRWGQGAHTTHAVDLDGDGRDEIILGSIVLDDDGSVFWEQKLGHPDHVYVGDIDPSREGLEVYFGMETGNPQNGMCLVEGKTGKLLWGHDKRTYHIHSTGMASDIDPNEPGTELWSGEENYPEERFLRNAKGKVLDKPAKFPVKDLAPRSVWWTGSLQRSLILGSKPVAYPSLEPVVDTPFEGS
ncbi:MAG: hypothetical protein LBN39_08385, partial [Planctomycetaceae bacterium]|nr:hypothetical protein [Planctomycetaceae bacterium]